MSHQAKDTPKHTQSPSPSSTKTQPKDSYGKQILKQWESEQRAPAPIEAGEVVQAMWKDWNKSFRNLKEKALKMGYKGQLFFVISMKNIYAVPNGTEVKIIARATRPTPHDNTMVFSLPPQDENPKLLYALPPIGMMHAIMKIYKTKPDRYTKRYIGWIKDYLDGKLK